MSDIFRTFTDIAMTSFKKFKHHAKCYKDMSSINSPIAFWLSLQVTLRNSNYARILKSSKLVGEDNTNCKMQRLTWVGTQGKRIRTRSHQHRQTNQRRNVASKWKRQNIITLLERDLAIGGLTEIRLKTSVWNGPYKVETNKYALGMGGGWLSSQEYFLLLRKSRVWFSAPTQWLQLSVTLVPGQSDNLF